MFLFHGNKLLAKVLEPMPQLSDLFFCVRAALLRGLLEPARLREDPGGRHQRGVPLRYALCGAPSHFLLLPATRSTNHLEWTRQVDTPPCSTRQLSP